MYENGDFSEAVNSYDKAITFEQQAVEQAGSSSKEYLSLYYNNRGLAKYHQRDFEDALKDYNEAISAINGTNAENFFNRGNVFLN